MDHESINIDQLKPILSRYYGFHICTDLCKVHKGWLVKARSMVTDEPVAIKILKKPPSSSVDGENNAEANILKSLSHRNIVKYYSNFDVEDTAQCLVMELSQRGSLRDYELQQPMRIVRRDARLRIMSDLIDAVAYLKSQCIAHCDIKPENVLIFANMAAKLTDFGSAQRYAPGSHIVSCLGTLGFMAPEISSGKPFNPELVDVYALGILLLEMATGETKPLMQIDDKPQESDAFSMNSFERLFVLHATQSDPERRISVGGLVAMKKVAVTLGFAV